MDAADLATMFSTDEFAVEATVVVPADIVGRTVAGIFDSAYLFVDAGAGVESAAPAFTVPDSSIPSEIVSALHDGDEVSLEIEGCTYTVVETQPDGTGITVLRLRK